MRIVLGALVLTSCFSPLTPGALKRPQLPEIGYPLDEVKPKELHSQFNDHRKGHQHHAIDLMRPRGTSVLAVTDGVIRKLYRSKAGGISIYLFDGTKEFCFFYGHLDRYAKNLHEGQEVHKGDLIAYVGYTGNAKRTAPHLHFAVSLTGPERRWSGGMPIDPYPMLLAATLSPAGAKDAETVAELAGADKEPQQEPRLLRVRKFKWCVDHRPFAGMIRRRCLTPIAISSSNKMSHQRVALPNNWVA